MDVNAIDTDAFTSGPVALRFRRNEPKRLRLQRSGVLRVPIELVQRL